MQQTIQVSIQHLLLFVSQKSVIIPKRGNNIPKTVNTVTVADCADQYSQKNHPDLLLAEALTEHLQKLSVGL